MLPENMFPGSVFSLPVDQEQILKLDRTAIGVQNKVEGVVVFIKGNVECRLKQSGITGQLPALLQAPAGFVYGDLFNKLEELDKNNKPVEKGEIPRDFLANRRNFL